MLKRVVEGDLEAMEEAIYRIMPSGSINYNLNNKESLKRD